jgi:hypothetical protein
MQKYCVYNAYKPLYYIGSYQFDVIEVKKLIYANYNLTLIVLPTLLTLKPLKMWTLYKQYQK